MAQLNQATRLLKTHVPEGEAIAVQQSAEARGLSVARWLREAIQWNLVREGRRAAPAEEEAYIRSVFRDVFAGVNFAAITAQATFLLQQQREAEAITATEGLPPELAQQKAALRAQKAVLDATSLFASPVIQQEYSWVQGDPDAVTGLFRFEDTGEEES